MLHFALGYRIALFLGFTFFTLTSILAQPGSVDESFDAGDGLDGEVFAVAVQGDGKIVLAGNFSTYNGVARENIARINADGSLDTSFDPGNGTDDAIYDVAVLDDGSILIGGRFDNVDGNASEAFAKLNSSGSFDASYDCTVDGSTVYDILIQDDDKVMIAGSFGTVNGMTNVCIARLHPDGAVDSTFDSGDGFYGPVYSIDRHNDGRYVTGGNFSEYDGTTANHVAYINADGSLDTSFDSGDGVSTGYSKPLKRVLAVDGGKALICGIFSSYNNEDCGNLARLNTDGSLDSSFDPGDGPDFTCSTLVALDDGSFLIGGYFLEYDNTDARGIARFYADGGVDSTFDVGSGPDFGSEAVFAFAEQSDGKIIVGGDYDEFDGSTSNDIVRIYGGQGPAGVNDDDWSDALLIYPNPSNGVVTVNAPRASKSMTLTLLDLRGRVLDQSKQSCNSKCPYLIDRASGTYVLTIETSDGGHFVKRVVIK